MSALTTIQHCTRGSSQNNKARNKTPSRLVRKKENYLYSQRKWYYIQKILKDLKKKIRANKWVQQSYDTRSIYKYQLHFYTLAMKSENEIKKTPLKISSKRITKC